MKRLILKEFKFFFKNPLMIIDSIPITIDLLIGLQNGKYKINRKNVEIQHNKTRLQKLFCINNNNENE